jgi:hypothetical protein
VQPMLCWLTVPVPAFGEESTLAEVFHFPEEYSMPVHHKTFFVRFLCFS